MQREGWRFPPERRHVLMDEERRQWLPPERVLEAVGVRSGQTAVDVGVGTGYWTEALSRLVGPTGKVYAVDVEPLMLEDVQTLILNRGLENVEVVQSEEISIPLPDKVADLVVLGFVLHEPSEPVEFLQEITRLLKPEGRVLVLDWQKWQTEGGPPVEHRISEEEAHALLGAAGLSGQALDSPTDDVYIILAREFRPDDLEMNTPTV